ERKRNLPSQRSGGALGVSEWGEDRVGKTRRFSDRANLGMPFRLAQEQKVAILPFRSDRRESN
ncbi:MAG TPA: hypothetical protein VJV97_06765, partial [Gemmatimonadaceae bacterium]|nr:hypothetical protein [Gemmatimonadaceae bacterium]